MPTINQSSKKPVGRPRENGSKNPFAGLGLDSWEEADFKKILEKQDMSARQVIRKLVREFIKENKAR
jgi:hypothetical protein